MKEKLRGGGYRGAPQGRFAYIEGETNEGKMVEQGGQIVIQDREGPKEGPVIEAPGMQHQTRGHVTKREWKSGGKQQGAEGVALLHARARPEF